MTVFNILNRKCEIFGKKILEASAGTGKTFAIEHIIVRLLIEKNSFITIDQILVVTFTKKATKELKYRIRNNIEKAIQFLSQKETEDIFDYLTPFINNEEAIFKLQNAIDLFDTSQIFTIHSFCFKNLRDFFLEADVLIESDEEAQNTQFIKKLVFDYFKFYIDPKNYSKEQIQILINSNRNIEELCHKITNEIEIDSNKRTFKTFNDLYKIFLEELKNFKAIDLDNIYKDFENIEKNYKKAQKFKSANFLEQLKQLGIIINNKSCTRQEFQNLLQTQCSIFEFLSEKNKKISRKATTLPEIIYQMKNSIFPIIHEAIDPKILYKRILNDISIWVNDNLEKSEILTYDRILIKMKKAIEIFAFKKKIQDKYKAVIIDEFQDTDSIQFEIFDKLFFANDKILAVYLIGDPKQSIYSFRKADLYTYLNAISKINEIRYLDTNFRSSRSLIESLNALFDESFAKKWLKLPKINKSLTYLPVKSGVNDDFIFQDNLASLHFFIADGYCKTQKWPTEDIELKYFGYITNEIMKLKKENGFSDNCFAVLVKDRYQAQRLKNFFNKYSIKSVTARSASLKNSPVINAMREFFEAVLFPYDINKVKIALKGPYIRMNDEVIKNIKIDKDVIFIEKFYFLRSMLKKGISFFFNSFFYSKWLDKTVLENIASLNDLRFYHETISLIEILITENNLAMHQVIDFFNDINNLDEDDENLKLDQTTESGVQILTTFMSKGLEYEIVFALGLANRNVEKTRDNHEEIDAEKMRQFYVALTRAKHRVYLPIAIDINEKEIKNGSFSCMEYFLAHVLQSDKVIRKNELLNKLQMLRDKNYISYSFVNFVDLQSNSKLEETIDLPSFIKFNRSFKSSYIYSFSSLHKEEKDFWDNKKQEADFPVGSEIGILFHNIFDKLIKNQTFEEKAIRRVIQESNLYEKLYSFEDKIFNIVKKTIQAPLLEEKGFCLKDVLFENLKSETEFLFSIRNDYIKGFIDLFLVHDDKYYIIDWKTNHLGETSIDYDIDNLEKHMNKHNYFLQAAIYSEGLKRHLNILGKDFDKTFGGVFYIFLRGLVFGKRQGVYHFFPDLKLLDQLDKKQLNNIDLKYE